MLILGCYNVITVIFIGYIVNIWYALHVYARSDSSNNTNLVLHSVQTQNALDLKLWPANNIYMGHFYITRAGHLYAHIEVSHRQHFIYSVFASHRNTFLAEFMTMFDICVGLFVCMINLVARQQKRQWRDGV